MDEAVVPRPRVKGRSTAIPTRSFAPMKRFLSSVLTLGIVAFFPLALTGCGEESKVETKETIKTPNGTKTITDTHRETTSGQNPPANP
jgi:hypothetical protein